MPITQLIKNEWVALADGPILDNIIIKNDHGVDVRVSTEDSGDNRGYIVVKAGERFDIPAGNFAAVYSTVGHLYPWIYDIITPPTPTGSPIPVEVEENEDFLVDLGDYVLGNGVSYTLVSVENNGPVVGHNVEVDPLTGVVTGSFEDDDVYTIVVEAVNAAGDDEITIEVTVVDPA